VIKALGHDQLLLLAETCGKQPDSHPLKKRLPDIRHMGDLGDKGSSKEKEPLRVLRHVKSQPSQHLFGAV
jgi:hypothetical protein